MNFREAAGIALAALITAFIIWLVWPTSGASERVLQAVVGVIVVAILAAIWALCRKFKPRPLRWIAKTFIKFIIGGLKAWAESERASVGTDTVWDWLTDQVFVVQRRYAFSVGCIAFSPDKGRLRLLMVERPFEGFGDDKVLLWPGGRVKGSDKDFESEVRRIVKDETGCM